MSGLQVNGGSRRGAGGPETRSRVRTSVLEEQIGKRFPDWMLQQAEKVLGQALKYHDRKIKSDVAKFIVEQNRGRAPQSLSMDLKAGITINIQDFTREAIEGQAQVKKTKIQGINKPLLAKAERVLELEAKAQAGKPDGRTTSKHRRLKGDKKKKTPPPGQASEKETGLSHTSDLYTNTPRDIEEAEFKEEEDE